MDKIIVSGDIQLEQLSELHILAEVNEHGYAFLSGLISKETSQRILRKKVCAVAICCETEGGTDQTMLFAGQIQKYTVNIEGGIYYFKAECCSASIEFDKEKRSRSFQNVKMTYGQLFRHMAGSGRAILTTKGGNLEIPHPFVQYEETDWEFLKRMAGYQETVLVPDICHPYPQVSIGMVQGKTYDMYELDGCETEKNIKQWRRPAYSIKIDGALDMNLCDKILYRGVKLVVLKKEVRLSNGLLICSCWIGKEQIKIVDMHFNHHLCGLRLAGTVEAIEGEKIKIRLAIDKANENQVLYEYTYLPVTGNGMYAMPETGSTVHLYFPDHNEKNAFAVDCLPSRSHEGLIPDCRGLETAQGKVLGLLPAELNMSTGSNEAKIADKSGIDFFTSNKTRLCAKGDIIIRNGGLANLQAKVSVHMEYSKGSNNYIHVEGVECTIMTKKFLTSDAGRKAEKVEQCDPKMTWKAAETAKNTVSKVLAAIPAVTVEGIGGKVLGGIPSYESAGMDIDLSKVAGVKIGGD